MEMVTTSIKPVALSEEQLTLLNKTICKDLNRDEVILFAQVCSSKQLDPFSNQIYAIKRGGRVTFQTGIDGFRSMAERTGQYDGQEGPFWIDQDGNRTDIWLKKEIPFACQVKIFRKGFSHPFVGTALASEFNSNMGLWQKMPAHMIAKCAEAVAFRKAFPQQFSGIYEKDEPIIDLETETPPPIPDDLKIKTTDPREEMLKEITKLLAKNTSGATKEEKLAYMQMTCGIKVFDDLKKLTAEELNTRILILRGFNV